MTEPNEGPGAELGRAYGIASLGFTFGAAVVVFTGLGWLADRWLHTLPAFTIGLTLVGAVLGFLNVYFKVRRMDEAAAAKRKGGR